MSRINELREEYSKIRGRAVERDSAKFDAAVVSLLEQRLLEKTSENFVWAAQNVQQECKKSAGTGIYAPQWWPVLSLCGQGLSVGRGCPP